MIALYKKFKKYYSIGKSLDENPVIKEAVKKSEFELNKNPKRSDVINFLLNSIKAPEKKYLEIGVRNPDHNFNKINAKTKYSVDPGIEFKDNPVDFPFTSDVFFEKLNNNAILSTNIKFDVIFIDGLHLAEQVEKDIENSLKFLAEDGFIVLHDCNPPTELSAREDYYFRFHCVMGFWNGTTWKAFFKYRQKKELYSCCIDSDWGIGIISKSKNIGQPTDFQNTFYEFNVLDKNRKESLNLISFEELKRLLS